MVVDEKRNCLNAPTESTPQSSPVRKIGFKSQSPVKQIISLPLRCLLKNARELS